LLIVEFSVPQTDVITLFVTGKVELCDVVCLSFCLSSITHEHVRDVHQTW